MNIDTDFNILTVPSYCGFSTSDYQYWKQLFDNRTIVFNSDVDEEIVEKVYLPLRDFEKDDSTAPVTLIINSPGGSVSDGLFLADYITQYKKPLNIIVTGYAASLAAIILCAGGKNPNVTRYCYPSTYCLLHDGYIALSTSEAKTAADIMAFNDKVDEDIKNFIIKNTNITAEDYESHTRKQWFIGAKEMQELNIIDKVIGSDD